MNEIDQLRLELAEARRQLQACAQREWTCYQALGYPAPVNEALPFLISKEHEDKLAMEKHLREALDVLDAISNQCSFALGVCKNSESR